MDRHGFTYWDLGRYWAGWLAEWRHSGIPHLLNKTLLNEILLHQLKYSLPHFCYLIVIEISNKCLVSIIVLDDMSSYLHVHTWWCIFPFTIERSRGFFDDFPELFAI